MAINFCTIDGETIDGFCNLQRAKVLTRLIAEKYTAPPVRPPTQGGVEFGGQPSNPNYGYTNPWYDINPNVESPNYEQPYITVRVHDLFGDEGTETLQTMANMDLVTVTNLEFQTLEPLSVEVTDLTFEDDAAVSVNIRDLEI